jgi:hypothetical protein
MLTVIGGSKVEEQRLAVYSWFFFANVCQTAGALDLLGRISFFQVSSNTLETNYVEMMLIILIYSRQTVHHDHCFSFRLSVTVV